jgi:hypothetical protein
MIVAATLVRDYVAVNLRRTKNDFITMYAGIMMIQVAMLLRYNETESGLQFLALLLWRSIFWLFILSAVLCVLSLGIAYFGLLPFARSAGVSMSSYIRSQHYATIGKSSLVRTDKERSWW